MKPEQAFADVELKHEGRTLGLKALVNTGAGKSVISKRSADKLESFASLKAPCELRTADREGRLRITGYCRLDVTFQGAEVHGGAVSEVAENLREDIDLIIGRPELDAWNIVFTPEGPRPRKVPIEFEVI